MERENEQQQPQTLVWTKRRVCVKSAARYCSDTVLWYRPDEGHIVKISKGPIPFRRDIAWQLGPTNFFQALLRRRPADGGNVLRERPDLSCRDTSEAYRRRIPRMQSSGMNIIYRAEKSLTSMQTSDGTTRPDLLGGPCVTK